MKKGPLWRCAKVDLLLMVVVMKNLVNYSYTHFLGASALQVLLAGVKEPLWKSTYLYEVKIGTFTS